LSTNREKDVMLEFNIRHTQNTNLYEINGSLVFIDAFGNFPAKTCLPDLIWEKSIHDYIIQYCWTSYRSDYTCFFPLMQPRTWMPRWSWSLTSDHKSDTTDMGSRPLYTHVKLSRHLPMTIGHTDQYDIIVDTFLSN
jgi:hypothetical protein